MPDQVIEAWLSDISIQLAESVQILTQQAPDSVRDRLSPNDVSRALLARVTSLYARPAAQSGTKAA